MTTITTTMGWVVSPSAGINSSADTLITVSHLNAHSFTAIILYTFATFITLSRYLHVALCTDLHIHYNTSPTHSHTRSRSIPDVGVPVKASCCFGFERPSYPAQNVSQKEFVTPNLDAVSKARIPAATGNATWLNTSPTFLIPGYGMGFSMIEFSFSGI